MINGGKITANGGEYAAGIGGGDGYSVSNITIIDNFLPDWCIKDDDPDNCIETWQRDIYGGGFPNCAATVENESWCETNDACEKTSIDNQGLRSCSRAWR